MVAFRRSGWVGRFSTIWTAAPEDHLGFVDLVTGVGGGGQARGVADRAVDIDHPAAGTADEVVVVVTDPILVACRRSGGLDASDEVLVSQNPKGVVDRLARDGADLGPHQLGKVVRRTVRSSRHRPEHCQPLGRDLETVSTKKVRFVGSRPQGHHRMIYHIVDFVQLLIMFVPLQ